MRNPQCLVLSLDFDGCTDKLHSKQAVINHISEVYTQFPSIKRVIFLIGSLRQSLRIDILNALRNSTYPTYLSCTSLEYTILPRLRSYLDAKHPGHEIEIVFDTFLQADIYSELAIGTSFEVMKQIFAKTSPETFKNIEKMRLKVMVKNLKNEAIELMHASHLADSSKITMIYSQLHHIASQYPDDAILMHFYDDKLNLLHGLNQFYKSKRQWIPANLTLKLFNQNSLPGCVPLSFGNHIIGHGEVNREFRQHLLQLADRLLWNSIPEHFPELSDHLEETLSLATANYKQKIEVADYDKIDIPNTFENESVAILCYQTISAQAREILDLNVELELAFFNDYLRKLTYFSENLELFEAIYQQTTILQKETHSPEDFLCLNDLECKLLNYHGDEFEEERKEAEDFAQTRCYFDEQVASFELAYCEFIAKLNSRIASVLATTEDELLKKVKIYQLSAATTIVAPKPRRASLTNSIFQDASKIAEEMNAEGSSLELAK